MELVKQRRTGGRKAIKTGEPSQLQPAAKISRVTRRSAARLTVSVKTSDVEQTRAMQEEAVRLFCRALIRLYLQDQGCPDNGKRLGIL